MDRNEGKRSCIVADKCAVVASGLVMVRYGRISDQEGRLEYCALARVGISISID